jgi:hypothetical protein
MRMMAERPAAEPDIKDKPEGLSGPLVTAPLILVLTLPESAISRRLPARGGRGVVARLAPADQSCLTRPPSSGRGHRHDSPRRGGSRSRADRSVNVVRAQAQCQRQTWRARCHRPPGRTSRCRAAGRPRRRLRERRDGRGLDEDWQAQRPRGQRCHDRRLSASESRREFCVAVVARSLAPHLISSCSAPLSQP